MRSGVILILLSMSLTPIGDALSKQLGQSQSPIFIVFLRYFTAGMIALLLARIGGIRVSLPDRGRAGLFIRTALVIGAMSMLIAALSMIPLANAVGGFLIAPIIATLIAVFWFHERLTLPRIIGCLLSFGGALLILRPGAGVEVGMFYALAGGVLLGAFLATTGSSSSRCHPVSALAVQCLLGSALLLPLALPHFDGMTLDLLLPGLGLGMVTAATHFLTVAAYQRAEAAKLAPFFYFNLVAAVVVGLVWFQEIPNWLTIGGLALIVSGGLVSLARESLLMRLLTGLGMRVPDADATVPATIRRI
ncbi:MAG: DMT family transporter [Rhodobacteraceae bacterium]|nr:DMT family transporter [Paracoccaceae bacterium]